MQGNGKVAVIDIGSNTIKALCVENREGKLHKLGAQSIEARLGGEQRNARPWLTDERREAAVNAVRALHDFVKAYDPDSVEAVATSAVRDAENQEQFHADIKRATGLTLRVLSEAQEATLIGRGISCDPDLPDLNSFGAVDLGGGSLECIAYAKGDIQQGISLPLGAVRLARTLESFGKLPMTRAEVRSIQSKVTSQLEGTELPFSSEITMVGCGGAFSVTRAILADRAGVDYESMPSRLWIRDLEGLFGELSRLSLEERCAIPHLPTGRADILPVALLVLVTLAKEYGIQAFHHSQYNLRFGLAATLLRHCTDEC